MMQRRSFLVHAQCIAAKKIVSLQHAMRLFVLLAGLSTTAALAQTPEPSLAERQAQGAQLQARRVALEQAYQLEVAECYQRFDVTRCRNAVREKRIEANAALRQEELAHSARERGLAAQEAQSRSEEKQREAHNKAHSKAPEGVAPASKSRPARDPQVQQRQDSQQRAAYEQKQREAAERRARLENRLRERDKPPAAPLPTPGTRTLQPPQ